MSVVAPAFDRANFTLGGWADVDAFTAGSIPGILSAMSLAISFFPAIKSVVFTTEEARDPARTITVAYLAGIGMLTLLAFGVMIFAGGSGGWLHVLVWLGLFELVAWLHGIIMGYERQMFVLARAGHLSAILGRIHLRLQTPHVATMAGAIVGIAATAGARGKR